MVLFNRFFRPDLDIETLSFTGEPAPTTAAEIHLPLTWIALLSRRVNVLLAASTGVDSYVEVVKFLLAGADSVATTSTLLRHGPEQMRLSLSASSGGLTKTLLRRSTRSAGVST